MTPYDEGWNAWDNSYPDDNPYEDGEDKLEWDRGYWSRDSMHLDAITSSMYDPFMEYLSVLLGIVLVVGFIAVVVKIFM
jgi:hypothetical protein